MKKLTNYLSSALGIMILAAVSLVGGEGSSPVDVPTPVVIDTPVVVDPIPEPVIVDPVVVTDNPSVSEPSRTSSPWQKPIYYGRSKSKSSNGGILKRIFRRR